MDHYLLKLATWIIWRLAPADQRDALIGDLLEEHALRIATAPASALKWYLRQVGVSIPALVWTRIRKPAWLVTLGVALLSYIATGLVEFFVKSRITHSMALDMAITFPGVVLITYLAGSLRRGAPLVLGSLMVLSVTLMTWLANEHLPLGYRIAYFVVGPAAVTVGNTLRAAVAK